jgi:hypothetical protein
MEVKLGDPSPPPHILDQLPDPVTVHAAHLPLARPLLEPHQEQRLVEPGGRPLALEIFVENRPSQFGQRDCDLVLPLALDSPQAKVRVVVADIERDDLGSPQAAVAQQGPNCLVPKPPVLAEDPFDRRPSRNHGQSRLPSSCSDDNVCGGARMIMRSLECVTLCGLASGSLLLVRRYHVVWTWRLACRAYAMRR